MACLGPCLEGDNSNAAPFLACAGGRPMTAIAAIFRRQKWHDPHAAAPARLIRLTCSRQNRPALLSWRGLDLPTHRVNGVSVPTSSSAKTSSSGGWVDARGLKQELVPRHVSLVLGT